MSTCVAFSPGTGRRKGPGLCHFLRERGGRTPGMRAAGPGRSAHCEPARGRGAEGPGSEGGARLPDWNPLSPPLGRHSPAGRRGPGRGGGGPRGAAAAATPDCSTGALRQAAARAHLPAAAPGRTIGCPRGAREIELSIHSWACRARARRRRSFPRGLSRTRAARPNRKARPRAGCGRARSLPPALRVEVASVGACHSGPAARCTGSWRTLSRRSLGCAWREAAAKL